jgi:osmotically-inducible protein OsmY
MGQSTFTPLFKTIPPERVGLFGEYDHKGLAKRVSLALSQNFEPNEIRSLRVNQRGAVVVLVGQIPNQRLLIKLVNTVMDVSGAVDVEINGISVAHRLKTYLDVKPSKDALLKLLTLVNSH